MVKPIAFMVMPYGERPTSATAEGTPAKVDFDALWRLVYRPLLEEMGYEAVRADMDLGGLIIKDMLERLVLADLVVADITIANANVYYEVGVRHGKPPKAPCVLVAAAWAAPLFDVSQMPRCTFALATSAPDDAAAAAIRASLKPQLTAAVHGTSPVHDAVPGYPDGDPRRATSFREYVHALSEFQGKVEAIRNAAPSNAPALVDALASDMERYPVLMPIVVDELVRLVRDRVSWSKVLELIDSLPKADRLRPYLREQRALAQAKAGDYHGAVAALNALIRENGASEERWGLLGGRYKELSRSNATTAKDGQHYADKAIEAYEKGMYLDLNAYYCASNLARLYRARNAAGDEEKARFAAQVAVAACKRALHLGSGDEWLHQTLLGAAFDAADVPQAEQLVAEVAKNPTRWNLESTLKDLEFSLACIRDVAAKSALERCLDTLRQAMR